MARGGSLVSVEALLEAVRAASLAAEQEYERDGAGSHHLRGVAVPTREWLAVLGAATAVELAREPERAA